MSMLNRAVRAAMPALTQLSAGARRGIASKPAGGLKGLDKAAQNIKDGLPADSISDRTASALGVLYFGAMTGIVANAIRRGVYEQTSVV